MKEKASNKNRYFYLFILVIICIVLAVFFMYIKNANSKVGKNGISKEEFKKIELGMSQKSVAKIVSPDDFEPVKDELEKKEENHIYRYAYKYYGENKGYAIITYEADYSNGDMFVLPEVSKKEQFNLK